MYNDTEKREYKRIELTKRKSKKLIPPYIARFQVKQYEWQKMPSDDWNIVAVKNLSAGGIVYNYSKSLEIDSILDLRIEFFRYMPDIHCTGRVVRIERLQPNSIFRIAAEFTEIGEQEKEMINLTVKAIFRNETKKNFFLEKLEKMKNVMTRKVAIAELQ